LDGRITTEITEITEKNRNSGSVCSVVDFNDPARRRWLVNVQSAL